MVARIPQMNTSSQLTVASLKKTLEAAEGTMNFKLRQYPAFAIKKEGLITGCDFVADLTALTVVLIESLFGIQRYGDLDQVDEYCKVLKNRATAISTADNNSKRITQAQSILSDYAQSSLSLCQLYGWSCMGMNSTVVQTVLTHTCTLLAYAVHSKTVCADLLFAASAIVAHWKTDLAGINYARLYAILTAADIVGALGNGFWGGAGWGSICDMLFSSQKGSWCFDLHNKLIHVGQLDFEKLSAEVLEYTWDDSVDLLKDAKIKRRICERAKPIKTTVVLTTKEINRIAAEQLRPVLTDVLNMCRVAMNEINTLKPQEQIKTDVFSSHNETSERFIKATLATAAKMSLADRKSSQDEIIKLELENMQLQKECRSLHRKILRMEQKTAEAPTSMTNPYEAELIKANKTIAALNAEIDNHRKYINSFTRQKEYIDQLKNRIAELTTLLDEVTASKQELQDCFDEVIAHQQTDEELEALEPRSPLTADELEQLRQIRAYGIVPDTAAMSKLMSLMPSSKIVLVGQHESLHVDIPANYELYFFVTALAGHKVYNKWRSRVRTMQARYCHCSSSGLNAVARQILLEYKKQILST